jgi:hypothetical protein
MNYLLNPVGVPGSPNACSWSISKAGCGAEQSPRVRQQRARVRLEQKTSAEQPRRK